MEERRKHPYFDFWLCAGSERLAEFTAFVSADLASREDRKRQRRGADALTFERCVSALVANLLLGTSAISLNRNHPSWRDGRYNRHGIRHDTMRLVIELAEGRFLTLTRGPLRGVASTLSATPVFIAEARRRSITAQDIGRERGEELILLTRKGAPNASPTFIDYLDTPQTEAMRREVAELNAFLREASIDLTDSALAHLACPSKRALHRRFILRPDEDEAAESLGGCFRLGGRLFGGFWETLRKEDRRASLRIDGEPIAEADYSALFLRLACALGGHPVIGDTDPYGDVPGLESHRKGCKKAVAALLFAPSLCCFPKETAELLPEGFGPKKTREALLAAFPGLEPQLAAKRGSTPIGYRLFRLESDALLLALRRLREAGVVALPLHDAVLVPQSAAELAKRELEAAALETIGVRVPVNVWRREPIAP